MSSQPPGKKGKKKAKGTTLSLIDFLGDAPPTATVKKIDWADESEDIEDLSYQNSYNNKQILSSLPTGPRASRTIEVDLSTLPEEPPFTAFVGNLPYEADENMLNLFFKDLKILSVRLPEENGRFKGYGYVEFEDRHSLAEALQHNDETFNKRAIRVDVAGNKNQENRRGNRSGFGGMNFGGGGGYDDGPDVTEGEWRRKPNEVFQPPSRGSGHGESEYRSDQRYQGDRRRGDRDYGGRGYEGGYRGSRGYGESDYRSDHRRNEGRYDDSRYGSRDNGRRGYEDRSYGGHRGFNRSDSFGKDDRGYGGDQGYSDRGYGGDRNRYGGDSDRGYGGDRNRYGGDSNRGYGGDRNRYGGDSDRGYGGDRHRYGGDSERGYGGDRNRYGGDSDRGYGGDRNRYGRDSDRDRGYGRDDRGFGDDQGSSRNYGQGGGSRSYGGDRGYDRDRGYSRDQGYGGDRGGGYRDARYENKSRDYGRDVGYQDERRDDVRGSDLERGTDQDMDRRQTSERTEGPSRPQLKLQPRTKPTESNAAPSERSSAIFGAAKPVDTAAREKEIERKLKQEAETVFHEKDERDNWQRRAPRRTSDRSDDGHPPSPRRTSRRTSSEKDYHSSDSGRRRSFSPGHQEDNQGSKARPQKDYRPAPPPKLNPWGKPRTTPEKDAATTEHPRPDGGAPQRAAIPEESKEAKKPAVRQAPAPATNPWSRGPPRIDTRGEREEAEGDARDNGLSDRRPEGSDETSRRSDGSAGGDGSRVANLASHDRKTDDQKVRRHGDGQRDDHRGARGQNYYDRSDYRNEGRRRGDGGSGKSGPWDRRPRHEGDRWNDRHGRENEDVERSRNEPKNAKSGSDTRRDSSRDSRPECDRSAAAGQEQEERSAPRSKKAYPRGPPELEPAPVIEFVQQSKFSALAIEDDEDMSPDNDAVSAE